MGRARPTLTLVSTLLVDAFVLASCATAQAGPLSSGPSDPARDVSGPAAFTVLVVNEKGEPLEGAEVRGSFAHNDGPVASTCCTQKEFTRAITGRDGRAHLAGAPLTFHGLQFSAAFRDWAPHTLLWSLRTSFDTKGQREPRIVLGAPRDVAGKVELPRDCAPRDLEVHASPPERAAHVDPHGAFVLRGIAPWATLWLSACGRHVRYDLEQHPLAPVVMSVPPAS